jgi:hypothetical protein
MHRIAASLLVLGLAAATGSAFAQAGYPADAYPPARDDVYAGSAGAQFDQARVVRVDPVIVSGYGNDADASQGRRCRSRRDDGYVGDDGYRDPYAGRDYRNVDYRDNGYSDGYRNDGYRNDGYRNDGYRSGGSDTGRNVATVVGGVVGAVLGSKVGGGSARYATAAVGSMVGGIAGRQVYENSHRPARDRVVTVCDPLPADGDGYTVDDGRVGAYDVTYEYAGRTYTTRTDHHPGDTIRVRVDVQAAE